MVRKFTLKKEARLYTNTIICLLYTSNTNGVTQRAKAKITAVDPAEDYRHLAPKALRDLPVGKALEENLKRLEVCSQKGLSERFDSSIGAGTVLMPFSGKYQLTPEEAMVAKKMCIRDRLDEPVSAVDRKGVGVFYDLVTSLRSEYHMPVILVSHDLGHVKKYASKEMCIRDRLPSSALPSGQHYTNNQLPGFPESPQQPL